MRNVYTYTITILLAILIFYGGGGVNLVSHCCDKCHSAKIELTVADCCNTQKSNCCQKTQTENNCCSNHSQDNNTCCNIERIDFEWNNILNPVVEIHPIELDILFSSRYIPDILLPTSTYTKTLFARYGSPPIALDSRFYLSLFAILLI